MHLLDKKGVGIRKKRPPVAAGNGTGRRSSLVGGSSGKKAATNDLIRAVGKPPTNFGCEENGRGKLLSSGCNYRPRGGK